MGLEYIKEASYKAMEYKNVRLLLVKDGVSVSNYSSSGILSYSKTVSWLDIECSRINPIIMAMDNI